MFIISTSAVAISSQAVSPVSMAGLSAAKAPERDRHASASGAPNAAVAISEHISPVLSSCN
jgi:hypothetical protein